MSKPNTNLRPFKYKAFKIKKIIKPILDNPLDRGKASFWYCKLKAELWYSKFGVKMFSFKVMKIKIKKIIIIKNMFV